MTTAPRILVLSASVGAGHMRAAEAVEVALRETVPEAHVQNLDVLEMTRELTGRLGEMTLPVRIVWGQEDRASPLDHGLYMVRRMPDARLVVLPRCGHSVQSERAEEFNALVIHFLEQG